MGITELVELTVRGCSPLVAGTTEGCEEITKAELQKIPGIPEELLEALRKMSEDFTANICLAKGTEGGGQGDNGDSASAFVKMNTVLWALPIFFFVSKLV